MFRFSLIALVLIACHQDVTKTTIDTDGTDLDETGAPADTGSDDTGTDTADTTEPYTGPRAVLEGWMSSNGVQYGNPGNTVEMGYWTFRLTSLDGAAHTVTVIPTAFAFTIDSNNDYRFGVDGNDVVAGDIVHRCWIVEQALDGAITTIDPDIGGPEDNSMSRSDYPVFTVGTDDVDGVTIGLWCSTPTSAPIGTKLATSMDYEVIGESVYDASTARDDNTGVLPQYHVRID